MFESLLIANRGEIACRVASTARRLGIRTIAVYSEADRDALHVRVCDEAHCIGPPRPAESYLRGEAILEVAARAGADAIHPGYGFLSENARFAEACQAAGVTFVGPSAEAIRAMGAKDAAKVLMEAAGVPVVPGYHGEDQELATFAKEASRIGHPLLVKAVAGGGGRGMRRVDDPDDLEDAIASARREARAAFGDERLLLEKFVERARHVEVQIFADAHGNALHLFERDCSIQRRYQKVIEEAPAPGMPSELRAAMGEAAVCAARAIDYRGAGTVEFIVDAAVPMQRAAFHFMEMNTRLQVEHPVTEYVTGQDLVEWQLRVAAGEPLPCDQDALRIEGHAIEVRLYAENPAKKFLPSTGTLLRLGLPESDGDVRVDTGFSEGDVVTPHYDAMIAKLIVRGRDRETARRRLLRALEGVEVGGPASNATLLHEIARHPAFCAGDVHTGFLEEHGPALLRPRPADARVLAAAALEVLVARDARARATARHSGDPWSPWAALDGFRISGPATDVLVFHVSGAAEPLAVQVRSQSRGWQLEIGDVTHRLAGRRDPTGRLHVELDGARFRARVMAHEHSLHVWLDGGHWLLERQDAALAAEEDESAGDTLASALPGRVVQVLVQAGDRVRRGQTLLVVEAMKMEHELRAPADGVVAEVLYAAGDVVEEGVALLRLETR